MRFNTLRLWILLGRVCKLRNSRLNFIVKLVPEISDCWAVGLLYILSILELIVGMDWSEILSHLLLEMSL